MIVLYSFLLGGLLCLLAQLLIDFTPLTPARILVLYVVIGVFLEAVGIFSPLREIFGCGATLPLIGFGSSIARGVRECVISSGWRGIFKGPLFLCGSVLSFTLICGFFFSLLFNSQPKKL